MIMSIYGTRLHWTKWQLTSRSNCGYHAKNQHTGRLCFGSSLNDLIKTKTNYGWTLDQHKEMSYLKGRIVVHHAPVPDLENLCQCKKRVTTWHFCHQDGETTLRLKWLWLQRANSPPPFFLTMRSPNCSAAPPSFLPAQWPSCHIISGHRRSEIICQIKYVWVN